MRATISPIVPCSNMSVAWLTGQNYEQMQCVCVCVCIQLALHIQEQMPTDRVCPLYNILSIVARLTLVARVCLLLLFVNLKSNWSFHAANTTYTCDINKLWMNTNGLSHVKRKCDFFMGLVGINSWRIFLKNVTREMLHFFNLSIRNT